MTADTSGKYYCDLANFLLEFLAWIWMTEYIVKGGWGESVQRGLLWAIEKRMGKDQALSQKS